MPLYEYVCTVCGFEFEELKSSNEPVSPCRKCGSAAEKKISRAATVIAGGTPVETVDMTIGREADKRWQAYDSRQKKRRGDKNLQPVEVPKTKTGQYMPVMGLGTKGERQKRQEFSTALQEHRRTREKKGQPQFTTVGDF